MPWPMGVKKCANFQRNKKYPCVTLWYVARKNLYSPFNSELLLRELFAFLRVFEQKTIPGSESDATLLSIEEKKKRADESARY